MGRRRKRSANWYQALMEQSRERQSWSELAREHDVVATTDANSSGTTSISTQDRGGSTSVTGNTDGNRVIMVYDGLSRGIETVRELRTGHDGNNSLESPTYNSDGKIVTQAFYDDNNRVTSRKDDKGNTTSYGFDTLNRKTSETFADSTSRSRACDKDGHVTAWTDQRLVDATMTLDDLGRVTQRSFDYSSAASVSISGPSATRSNDTHVEGTTTQTFRCDGLSRVTRSTDNNVGGTSDDSTLDCDFDSLSRCLSADLGCRWHPMAAQP